MSRKRYISTDISTDVRLAELAEYGFLPLLLYSWAIPHLDDWGRMNGDSRQFKLTVCPALDVTTSDVDRALDQIAQAGLWLRYEADGKRVIAVPSDRWFKHQSYISKDKRNNDEGSNFKPYDYRETPQNTEEHRVTPKITELQQEPPQIAEIQQGMAQIAASFSLSSSPSFSASVSENKTYYSSSHESIPNIYKFFESEGFGKITEMTREYLIEMEESYTATWVYHAMKAAVKQGVMKISYIQKILKGWETKNHDEPWTLEKEEPPAPAPSNVTPIKGRYQKGNSGKPQIPGFKPSEEPAQWTEEEKEAAREKARMLDEKFKNPSTRKDGVHDQEMRA